MAILSWGVAILKSDYSVSLCQFSKKRSEKKIGKELDNNVFWCLGQGLLTPPVHEKNSIFKIDF